jgi:hypothetical protein
MPIRLLPVLGLACLWAVPLSAQAPSCGSLPEGASTHACICAPGPHGGSVWVSGPYTGDSDVCTAAVHAGVLGPDGGQVILISVLPPESFRGSESNGVTSGDWGSYPDAYTFYGAAREVGMVPCRAPRDEEATLDCTCPALAPSSVPGAVWGSGPYTADSDVCTAARHAGVIGDEGGAVLVMSAPGAEAYAASERNGVTTSAWGAYPSSFAVERPPF